MAKRLNSLADCRRFLAAIVNQLDVDAITAEKARTAGYLLGIMHRLIETGDLENRLEKLEQEIMRGEQ